MLSLHFLKRTLNQFLNNLKKYKKMVLCQNILRQSRNVFNSSKVIIKSINSPVNQQFMRLLNISSINFAGLF